MNIVVINGQNHMGSTWHIANILLKHITGNRDVKEFFCQETSITSVLAVIDA